MVENSADDGSGGRTARCARIDWTRAQRAFETGQPLSAIAQAQGCAISTLSRRARAEAWRHLDGVARLREALELELEAIDAVLSQPAKPGDPDHVRAVSALARAAEKLEELERRRMQDAEDKAEAESADLDALKAELERRLDQWARGGETKGFLSEPQPGGK
ncbi:MAG: hypothetical protein ACFB2Z_02735 [Maricaulaceae bacterium]